MEHNYSESAQMNDLYKHTHTHTLFCLQDRNIYILFIFQNFGTNPGNDRNAAGYKAAGNRAGPHGGNKIGDHVKNGADGGMKPLNCDVTGWTDVAADIRSSVADDCRVGDGDGEHRRFLLSVATIASFMPFNQSKLHEKSQNQISQFISIDFMFYKSNK